MKLFRITTKPYLHSGPWHDKKKGLFHFANSNRILEFMDAANAKPKNCNFFYLWEVDFPFKVGDSDAFNYLIPNEILKLGKIRSVKKVHIGKISCDYTMLRSMKKFSKYRVFWLLADVSRGEIKNGLRKLMKDELDELSERIDFDPRVIKF